MSKKGGKGGKGGSMKLGGGGRFAALKKKLGNRKGVSSPGALAAYIGRKKYGKAKFQKLAASARRTTEF